MSGRPTVLLDCDGVLADFVGAYLSLIANLTERTFTRDQVVSFDIGRSLDLPRDEAAEVKRWIGRSCGWCEALDVYPGAVDGVRALEGVADVYIVTSPWDSCATWESERKAWLRRHFGIPAARVVSTAAKYLVSGHVLVDDRTETLRAWCERQPGVAVQWHTPHNRFDGWEGISTRSWDDVLCLVREARP